MSVFKEQEIIKIKSLMSQCGELLLSVINVESDKKNIRQKSGKADLVTVFDVKVQEILIKGLSELFPDAHFLAEEKDNLSKECEKGLCFVIDPIDGTANFVHSLKASAISVGALYDSKPVFGAVFDPYRNEFFTAVKGEGAFLNGEKISVSEREMQSSIICFGTSPYKKDKYGRQGFINAENVYMNCADLRRSGSACVDLCSVAAGRTDGFFEPELSPWDYCAGAVIVSEAGGIYSSYGGNEVSFTSPSSFICGNKEVHSKLKALCK